MPSEAQTLVEIDTHWLVEYASRKMRDAILSARAEGMHDLADELTRARDEWMRAATKGLG